MKGIIRKFISQKGRLLYFLELLMSVGLPLIKKVLTPLAKSVLLPLELTEAVPATKNLWIRHYSINNVIQRDGRYNENN